LKSLVVWYAVKRCAKRAGIENLAPHDLRRSAARAFAVAAEANSNRSSFCLTTVPCKRLNAISDASRTSKKRSMTDLEFQSQAMRLRKCGTSRLRAMLVIGPLIFMIQTEMSTAVRMPEPQIRRTTSAQPTRMIRFHVLPRERLTDRPSVDALSSGPRRLPDCLPSTSFWGRAQAGAHALMVDMNLSKRAGPTVSHSSHCT
jgi:hypothetical protein